MDLQVLNSNYSYFLIPISTIGQSGTPQQNLEITWHSVRIRDLLGGTSNPTQCYPIPLTQKRFFKVKKQPYSLNNNPTSMCPSKMPANHVDLKGQYLDALKALFSFNLFFKIPFDKQGYVCQRVHWGRIQGSQHPATKVCCVAEWVLACEAAATEVDATVCAAAQHAVNCTNSKAFLPSQVSLSKGSLSDTKKKHNLHRATKKKLKKYCRTTHQANQECTNQMIKKQHFACVFIIATVIYYIQQKQILCELQIFNCNYNENIISSKGVPVKHLMGVAQDQQIFVETLSSYNCSLHLNLLWHQTKWIKK